MALGYSQKVGVPHISPAEFASMATEEGVVILDVREDEEVATTRIENAYHIPLGELEGGIQSLKAQFLNSKILVICRSGIRSAMATEYMLECGFKSVLNLDGGILELAKIDDRITIY